MMKLVKLDNKSAELFRELDPFDYLHGQGAFPTFALGCVNESDVMDEPAGLVICYRDRSVLVVRWIFAEPWYRGRGVSDMLLSAVFEIARNEGAEYVGALLSNEYGREEVCPDEEAFFSFLGFDRIISTGDGRARLLLAPVTESDEDDDSTLDDGEQSLFDFSFDVVAADDGDIDEDGVWDEDGDAGEGGALGEEGVLDSDGEDVDSDAGREGFGGAGTDGQDFGGRGFGGAGGDGAYREGLGGHDAGRGDGLARAGKYSAGIEIRRAGKYRRGGKREIQDSDIHIVAGDVFGRDLLMRQESDDRTEIASIGDITLPMLGDGLKRCSKVTKESAYGEVVREIPVSYFNERLSACAISNGAVTGLFLVHEEEGRLYPEYLCACGSDSRTQCKLMLRHAAKVLRDNYPEDTQIIVRCRDDVTREQVERLFSMGETAH
ncbi:MAG: GNAT family N-acetyltransferase [Butyrivibrio sp.]|nr:GNAT family N-acetyltransferase [Butyrivibrio sp.]